MTPSEAFLEAAQNALVYGTGFVRVGMNNHGGIDVSVVDPRDYRYLEPVNLQETRTPTMIESLSKRSDSDPKA